MTDISQKSGRMIQGLNILFTGEGKGKTTAAMGTMFRAYGQGLSVGVIQFIKSPQRVYGEARTAEKLGIPFSSLGNGFVRKIKDQDDARQFALSAWEEARRWIASRRYALLVLDEVTYIFHFKWLDVHDFLDWIRPNKPPAMHLLMTGRYAPTELADFADLVTEMREVKHPFREQGIPAQLGVDF